MENLTKYTWSLLLLFMLCMSLPSARADTNNIILDDPLSSALSAVLTGVSGGNFVGTYVGNDSGTYSFVTDGTNYTILNDNPLAQSGSTLVNGISGTTIFGSYLNLSNTGVGFLNSVNSTNYMTIADPLGVGINGTSVIGVSGSNSIGDFVNGSGINNSYFYNGTNYLTLNDTDTNAATNTTLVMALSGGGIVGNYQDLTSDTFGFYFDGTNYTTIDYGANSNGPVITLGTTLLTGISGIIVAGNALDGTNGLHGFLWDTTTASFTPIDVDTNEVLPTWITGISGSNVVGNSVDGSGITNGFLTSDGGGNYTTIVYPFSANGSLVQGVGGGTIYGTYQDSNLITHNFVTPDDGVTYTTIDGPPNGTAVLSVSTNAKGTNAIGSYSDIVGNSYSFFYNGTNYTTLTDTNAAFGSLTVVGMSGTNVAGTYLETNTGNGFTYGFMTPDGTNFTDIQGPAGTNGGVLSINGISGSNVAGTYSEITDDNGYTYGFRTTDGTHYTILKGPAGYDGYSLAIAGISGSTVVGTYSDSNGNTFGFQNATKVAGPGGVVDGSSTLDSVNGITANGSIVGTYADPNSGNTYGFVASSIIKGPDGTNGNGINSIDAIAGNSIGGTYTEANTGNSYTYGYITANGSSYSIVTGPSDSQGGISSIIGVSGSNAVGTYTDGNGSNYGFFFNGISCSKIDFPEALPGQTTINGVVGKMIYGSYNDSNALSHGFYIQRSNQSISTYTITNTNAFGVPNPSTTLPLTNSAGLLISYTVLSGSATISGNTLTFTGAGTVTVEADQSGNNAYYAAASVTNSVAVAKGSQTISFPAVTNQVYGIPFTVSPTSSSGLQVSVTIFSGLATNSGTNGTTITPTGTGTLVLAADQSGDSNYDVAARVTNSVTVLQATQSIAAFTGITNRPFTTNPFTITLPAATSLLPVTLTATGVATNTSNSVTLLGAGTVTLTASQSGNSNYLAATDLSTNFVVTKGSQSIAPFPTISSKTFGNAPFSVMLPAASSALLASLSIASGPATLSNNTVSLTGAGTVTLAADQSGNANYNAAPQVTTSFAVAKASQTITQFSTIPNQQGLSSVTITNPPTASSGLPVVLSLLSGEATISGNTITPTNSPTTIVVAANQVGDTNYNAATQVTNAFSVGKTDQSIGSFTTIPDQPYSTNLIMVTVPGATPSGLPIALSVISGPATLSSNSLTLTGVGTVVLAANQAGDAIYGPAAQVTTSFVVSQTSQTIQAFTTIANHTYGDAAFSVTPPAGGNSGNAVTLSILSGPATLSNNFLTMTGAGTVTVAADQLGNADYTAAPQVITSFSVSKAAQTISAFAPILNQKKPMSVTITIPTGGNSGQPVLVSVLSGPATIDTNTDVVTPTNKGVVTLAANQAGNVNYTAAPQVTTNFLVTLLPQTIGSFTGKITNGTIPYSPHPFAVPYPKVTPSALPVKLSILSGPAKIVGNNLTMLGTGTVTLAANQIGNGKYAPAPQTTISFTVTQGTQTIAFFTGIKKQIPYKPTPFSVVIPKSSSEQPVTLTATGAASNVGNLLTLTGVGTVTLTATQVGSPNYLPASLSTNFVVTQATQTIKPFKAIPVQTNGISFNLTNVPTASSGLPVSLGLFSGSATIVTNSISSYTITPTAVGTVTLSANQPESANYLAAPQVKISFRVK